MKKLVFVVCLLAFVALATAGNFIGPAPNMGDGVSDGSGMDGAFQIGEPEDVGVGPAPNSGDGVRDGSGF